MVSCKLTVCVLNLDHVITGLPDASSRKPFTTAVSRKQSYSVVNTLCHASLFDGQQWM
jgi:hypothetical protein